MNNPELYENNGYLNELQKKYAIVIGSICGFERVSKNPIWYRHNKYLVMSFNTSTLLVFRILKKLDTNKRIDLDYLSNLQVERKVRLIEQYTEVDSMIKYIEKLCNE